MPSVYGGEDNGARAVSVCAPTFAHPLLAILVTSPAIPSVVSLMCVSWPPERPPRPRRLLSERLRSHNRHFAPRRSFAQPGTRPLPGPP